MQALYGFVQIKYVFEERHDGKEIELHFYVGFLKFVKYIYQSFTKFHKI